MQSALQQTERGLGQLFIRQLQEVKKFETEWRAECEQWYLELRKAIQQDERSIEERGGSIDAYMVNGGRLREKELLQQLHFSEISSRDGRIAEAYAKTFTWIFGNGNDRWVSFANWLRGNDGIYWITGKPGSGKSTLMKYIYNDQRTLELLEEWAAPSHLITAVFYFWNSGVEIQMSQEGLLRSLLYQILRQVPELLPRLFPGQWEVSALFGTSSCDWSQNSLRSALRHLSVQAQDLKFCLFVDGLDEFDGDHVELTNFLMDLAASPNIKLCAASRPWNEFQDSFKSRPSLLLQDLTHDDIKHFVSSRFHSDRYFAELEARESDLAKGLVDKVVEKAAGVFLWVQLVVRSLLSGLRNGDRVSDFQKRLDLLPPDLENLYQKILDSLDPFYFEHAVQFFELVKTAEEPLSLLEFSFADEEPEFLLTCPVHKLTPEDNTYRAEVMK